LRRRKRSRRSPVLPRVAGIYKPVIAAVEGYALGGGSEIALLCDSSSPARRPIRPSEAKLGPDAGRSGDTDLSRIIGKPLARN